MMRWPNSSCLVGEHPGLMNPIAANVGFPPEIEMAACSSVRFQTFHLQSIILISFLRINFLTFWSTQIVIIIQKNCPSSFNFFPILNQNSQSMKNPEDNVDFYKPTSNQKQNQIDTQTKTLKKKLKKSHRRGYRANLLYCVWVEFLSSLFRFRIDGWMDRGANETMDEQSGKIRSQSFSFYSKTVEPKSDTYVAHMRSLPLKIFLQTRWTKPECDMIARLSYLNTFDRNHNFIIYYETFALFYKNYKNID